MEFLHTDTPDDVELKLQVLEIYNHKLDERERRRELLLQHGELVAEGETTRDAADKAGSGLSADEKRVVEQLRLFSRFQTPEEHTRFVEGISEENRLRKRLRQVSHGDRGGNT